MSSTVVHDRPLSPCNHQAVTSAATSRWDDAFPTNNHPCKTIFCKTAGRLLPSPLGDAFIREAAHKKLWLLPPESSERAAIRSWVCGASNTPHSPHRNFRAQDLYPDQCFRDTALKSFAQLT